MGRRVFSREFKLEAVMLVRNRSAAAREAREARADIFVYMEAFYNSRRPQSTLEPISAMKFERIFTG